MHFMSAKEGDSRVVDFNEKVAVITGGAGGIGLALAKRLADEGAKIMLADISEDALAKAVHGLSAMGATASSVKTDVTSNEDWSRLVNETIDRYGRVDFLFNNAGVYLVKSFDYLTETDWNWLMDVNFFGPLKGVRAFMPVMEKQATGGHIVFTASIASCAPKPNTSTYEASKAALLRLAECCFLEAKDAGKENMKFAVIMPSFVVTDLFDCDVHRPIEYCNTEEIKSPADLQAIATRKGADLTASLGAIEPAVAVARIIDQLKKGYFYIYTHRTFTKEVILEQTARLLKGYDPPMHLGQFMVNYYQRKKLR